MASILKVDKIQLPDGSAPTASDLGIDVSGTVLQVQHFEVSPVVISTGGSWAAATEPTGSATYGVQDFQFARKSTTSKIVAIATGHVDHYAASGHPSIVAITNGLSNGTTNGGKVYGSSYRHVQYQNNEPFAYTFAFEDSASSLTTYQADPANPHYYLRCHSSASSMAFGRTIVGNYNWMKYSVTFYEIEQ